MVTQVGGLGLDRKPVLDQVLNIVLAGGLLCCSYLLVVLVIFALLSQVVLSMAEFQRIYLVGCWFSIEILRRDWQRSRRAAPCSGGQPRFSDSKNQDHLSRNYPDTSQKGLDLNTDQEPNKSNFKRTLGLACRPLAPQQDYLDGPAVPFLLLTYN